jgi:glutamate-5-semialdehyde dehydrogenase
LGNERRQDSKVRYHLFAMDLPTEILDLGRRARAAAKDLARLNSAQKNAGLRAMADALLREEQRILAENALDLQAASDAGLADAMIDRLALDGDRLAKMAAGIREVAALPDPVGETIRAWTRPNGLAISKVRVPIGVVGIIYESRPNVTSDAAVLCTKTGNATILRGGSEALRSNLAITHALREGAASAGLPADSVLIVPSTDRAGVRLLAEMDAYIDMIVPRGGQALIEAVVRHARMPVIKHYTGLCILYVDQAANLEMASGIALNAKCQRPGVCNAIETLLVHEAIADSFLQQLGPELWSRGVKIHGDEQVQRILGGRVIPATDADWAMEYLDLELAIKIVSGLDAAISHIEEHGSHHSDAIVTDDPACAERFLNEIDSATVYWNASTRFTDGNEFGFGTEVGISTDKLHARGPMGLEELTTYKYVIRGDGQVRE